jgi:hypothetical protein
MELDAPNNPAAHLKLQDYCNKSLGKPAQERSRGNPWVIERYRVLAAERAWPSYGLPKSAERFADSTDAHALPTQSILRAQRFTPCFFIKPHERHTRANQKRSFHETAILRQHGQRFLHRHCGEPVAQL